MKVEPMPQQHLRRSEMKHITLALQGGGAHGAFTWGVLDRLMRDGRIFISGLSGTSAGAMNAVVFSDGFLKGRREGAIEALERFWRRVSDSALMSPMSMAPWWQTQGSWNMDNSPPFACFDIITRLFSPYQLNPMNLNPLRDILAEQVDFRALRRRPDIKLFVSATNVRTCKLKVFRTQELTEETLLASACLPIVFQAVEVEGEHYWDGGYMANPAMYPLVHECSSNDIVIVQINPMKRPELPTTAREILNRMNEISFNSTLVREMRGFAVVTKLLESGHLQGSNFQPVNFHMIQAEVEMSELGASSKFNADWKFLRYLYELGMETTDVWLKENFDRIEVESTLDVFDAFH